ncbi:hypothetical protein PRIPAC_79485 [Pristionchus pacificus]|uniref:Phosphatase n=1 Tax=Pristionchus pacificus TaxID=54126 RepID=A0A2A6CL91_PRIPA|nr:hypothetical protein PRIPAC_79485 [Pristionchus pacificus]|eukprot:PDM79005.1 Phosphatase [Pristionchus pacificus]
MRSILLLLSIFALGQGQKLLFAQTIWRHGLRTPIGTYTNDPYQEAFFGVPEGELLAEGMRQEFVRGQQLQKMYGQGGLKLVGDKYSRYETYVRSGDFPRCTQSALANLAGFYEDSPTFPTGVPGWPSAWTPVPLHTVPHDEDYILEQFDICPKLFVLQNERNNRQEFQDFVASNWRVLHTINVNSGDPEDYSYGAMAGMAMSLEIEKACNLTMPDWVTDEFYDDLETAVDAGGDYFFGEAAFGLPLDQRFTQLSAGFLLKDWMDNIDAIINGTSTLKYYAYSGHDMSINSILIGLGMKSELIGGGDCGYAATIACELWEKDGEYFVKLQFSPNSDSGFEPFTNKLPGCGADLCPLTEFWKVIQPLIADDVTLWRHGLRTPINTYAADPYNEAFFGVPQGELLAEGMRQHIIRGQQLRKMYIDDANSSVQSTVDIRSIGRFCRCSQSALANMAGFYQDSPTYPNGVPDWPSAWTPIPVHTVPHGEDWVLEAPDICIRFFKLKVERQARKEFQDFVASNWRILHTINANSGEQADYSFNAMSGMYMNLGIEKSCNLTMPDWVTDDFYADLQAAVYAGNDYIIGEAGFGLLMDPEFARLASGFLLKEWMDNLESVINGTSTVKYYAYSGHDTTINTLLIGLGVKSELIGPANCDYAATVSCELWEKDGELFIKLLFSANSDSEFVSFTRKVPGCASDLCSLSDFKNVIKPFIADNVEICRA